MSINESPEASHDRIFDIPVVIVDKVEPVRLGSRYDLIAILNYICTLSTE
jgi:hypothetical protein